MRPLHRRLTWLVLGLLPGVAALAAEPDPAEVDRLWAEVDAQVVQLRSELGFDHLSPPVVEALRNVPRHRFIPESDRGRAYRNRPVPIGYGQTISQPLIVAIMTELLALSPGEKVFELGTGSGYQAAVLDRLGVQVFSVEIVEALGQRARGTLDAFGHDTVQTRIGDGYQGWPSQAPFDAIIVTAASDHIPPPLIRQLKAGGRMLIPVGDRYRTQRLVLVTRAVDGRVTTREIIPVTFVPLTGER